MDNDALLAYSKADPATGDTVLVVVSLDPHHTAEAMVWLDLPALGCDWHERFTAHDEVTGADLGLGPGQLRALEPWNAVAHIISVER